MALSNGLPLLYDLIWLRSRIRPASRFNVLEALVSQMNRNTGFGYASRKLLMRLADCSKTTFTNQSKALEDYPGWFFVQKAGGDVVRRRDSAKVASRFPGTEQSERLALPPGSAS